MDNFHPKTPYPTGSGDEGKVPPLQSRIIMLRIGRIPSAWWCDQPHGLFGNCPLDQGHTVSRFSSERPHLRPLLSCGVRRGVERWIQAAHMKQCVSPTIRRMVQRR